MKTFRISGQLQEMLGTAALNAGAVNRAIEYRVKRRWPAVIGPQHYHSRALSSPGMRAIIFRSHGALRLDLEFVGAVFYRERSAKECVISFPGIVPQAYMTACRGLTVREVIGGDLLPRSLLGRTVVDVDRDNFCQFTDVWIKMDWRSVTA